MTDISTIWQFPLRKGNSKNPREGACLLDAVSWFEYGGLGDHPPCVCETLAAPGRIINDLLPDDRRQELRVLIPRLVGTEGDGFAQARAAAAAWRAIRVFAPLALDAAGLHIEATSLRNFSGTLMEATKAAEEAAQVAAEEAMAAAQVAMAAAEEAAQVAAEEAMAAAEEAAWAPWAAVVAAKDATWAPWAAEKAARAANTDVTPVYDAAISAMVEACEIGKPAAAVVPERMVAANRSFAMARS